MSARLGIGIAAGEVRAVLVRGGAIAWHGDARVSEPGGHGDAVRRLLDTLPPRRWGERLTVQVAIGPAAAQVKRLHGAPPLRNRRMLERMVTANLGRFFLRNGVPLGAAAVHMSAPGVLWAATAEAPLLEEVRNAVRARGMRLGAVTPTVALLPWAMEAASGSAEWADGGARAQVAFEERGLTEVRRLPALDDAAASEPATVPRLREPLAGLDERAWRFADAYAAAVAIDGAPLTMPLDHESDPPPAATVARRAALAAGALVALLAALVLPAQLAREDGQAASAALRGLVQAERAIASTQLTLAEVTGTLQQVADFSAQRRARLPLLGAMAMATPDSTAMISLRLHDAEGQAVVLAPSVTEALATLVRVEGVRGASIASPVTRELVNGREMERATIRLAIEGPR